MCRCWWLRTRHGLHRLSAIVRLTGVAAFGEGRKPGTFTTFPGFQGVVLIVAAHVWSDST